LTYLFVFPLLLTVSYQSLFANTRLQTFVARLLLSQGGFFPHVQPFIQCFGSFFTPLLEFPGSFLNSKAKEKHNVHGKQTRSSLWRPMASPQSREAIHKRAPHHRPFNRNVTRHRVDDHGPSPSSN
jgi:hypothetical protein